MNGPKKSKTSEKVQKMRDLEGYLIPPFWEHPVVVVVDNIKYLLELELKESLAAVVVKENIGAKIDKALETPNP